MKSQCPLPPQILKCSIHIQRSIPPRRIRITPVIRPVCAADQHIFDIRRGHENLISFYQSPFHDLRTCPGCDRCRRTRPGHGHKTVPQSRSIHIHRRGTEIRLYLTGKCKMRPHQSASQTASPDRGKPSCAQQFPKSLPPDGGRWTRAERADG